MKICKKCGGTEKDTRGSCRLCARRNENSRRAANPEKYRAACVAWKAKNKEKVREYNSKWNSVNRDIKLEGIATWRAKNISHEKKYAFDNRVKILAKGREWVKNNPEKVKRSRERWKSANPDILKRQSQNRRARKRSVGGTLSKDISEKLFKLQKGKCACCGKPLGNNYHMDHIMPLALGGANEDWNIQLLTQRCNNQKYTKHPIDFMQERGFLL